MIGKMTEGAGNQRKNRDYPGHIIVKIGKNAQKSSGDMKCLLSLGLK